MKEAMPLPSGDWWMAIKNEAWPLVGVSVRDRTVQKKLDRPIQ